MKHPFSFGSEPLWSNSPKSPSLKIADLHIWRACLDLPQKQFLALNDYLSADETERAERFKFNRDSRRYIVCRGILRKILSLYTGIAPSTLRFDYSSFGKPSLKSEDNRFSISFNLSHSEELSLYAFNREREIGIDVEQIRPMPDAEQIAAKFFSAKENADFNALPNEMKTEGFFNCWTRKEAYIKAIGEGISHPLDQFDVTLAPGEPALLQAVVGDRQKAAQWTMTGFKPALGYVAACTIEGRIDNLSFFQFLAAGNTEIAEN